LAERESQSANEGAVVPKFSDGCVHGLEGTRDFARDHFPHHLVY
jgi:hypothetical protein